MRSLPQHAKTAAVALTGYGGASDIDKAYEAGFNAHVSKPVSLDALEKLLVKLDLRKGKTS
ncbi:hypothetical protein HP436_03420 [Pseudomonas sp. CrR14]|nr:hypothetical protein [Pseudomonas sp. CrR14]